jgi:hypothetical protein
MTLLKTGHCSSLEAAPTSRLSCFIMYLKRFVWSLKAQKHSKSLSKLNRTFLLALGGLIVNSLNTPPVYGEK